MIQIVLARYCYRMSSVRPSVCPSETLMCAEHIRWTISKLITRIISLGLRCSEPQHRQSSPTGTPLKFGWNWGGSRSPETCNISETGQDRTKVIIDDLWEVTYALSIGAEINDLG